MKTKSVIAMVLAAGTSAAMADIDVQNHGMDAAKKMVRVGHIFISSTGERVFLDHQAQNPRVGEIDQWIQAEDLDACPGNNFFTAAVDPDFIAGGNPTGDPANDSSFGYNIFRDWGDIDGDNVIDSLTTAFATGYIDPTPNDTIADDVVGNNLIIQFEDAQGGGNNPLNANSQVIAAVGIADLPAGPDTGDTNTLSGFTITVELGQPFEIGDTNGMAEEDCVGDTFNANSFTDLDGDSLHDFSWDFVFEQPGLDGQDPATYGNAVTQGMSLAYPDPVLAATGGPFPLPGAAGSQDVYSRLDLRNTSGDDLFDEQASAYAGSWFFGGFVCSGPDLAPWGGFEMQLFGPTPGTCGDTGPMGCNAADLAEPFGQLTFGDIGAFLAAFDAMEPAADLAEPFGQFTFGDIGAFLAAFDAGCP
jgi:hypothetical protein